MQFRNKNRGSPTLKKKVITFENGRRKSMKRSFPEYGRENENI